MACKVSCHRYSGECITLTDSECTSHPSSSQFHGIIVSSFHGASFVHVRQSVALYSGSMFPSLGLTIRNQFFQYHNLLSCIYQGLEISGRLLFSLCSVFLHQPARQRQACFTLPQHVWNMAGRTWMFDICSLASCNSNPDFSRRSFMNCIFDMC